MVDTVDFAQFVSIFPRMPDVLLVDAWTEMRFVTADDGVFVAPTLKNVGQIRKSATVVLVEARAALGKSTMARNLALETKGIYWDMSEIFTGHGTLLGRLAATFGTSGLPTVLSELMGGDRLLVLDALDEAELRSANRGFDAFLDDVRTMMVAPRRKPSMALFGRSETIEYIAMTLGSDLAIARYEIEEFDKPTGLRFIDSRLDYMASRPRFAYGRPSYSIGRNQHAGHRLNRRLFERARDLLLSALEKNLVADTDAADDTGTMELELSRVAWRNDRARGFLGYAPVLESVSEYLDGGSSERGGAFFRRLINALTETLRQPAATSGSQWALLRSIVEELLDREEEKFLKQAREVLTAPSTAAWNHLYHRDVQLRRVFYQVNGIEPPAILPAGFPADQEADYRRLLKNALYTHPFLSSLKSFVNVVMRDFTLAWAMASADRESVGLVHRIVNDESFKVSPMLGRFYLSLDNPDEAVPSCRAEFVGLIYESLVAEYSTQDRPSLILSKADRDDDATLVIGGSYNTAGSVIRVPDAASGIQFWRRLSNAKVLGGVSVVLGAPGRMFTLGPQVVVQASLFEVPAQYLRVSCHPEADVRVVAEDGYLSNSQSQHEPEIDVRGEGLFGVHWDEMRFPWIQYATIPLPAEVDEHVLLGDFVLLSRIMMHNRLIGRWTNSSVLTSLSRKDADARLRKRAVIGTTPPRMAQLARYLVHCGILGDEYWYSIDTERLRAHGLRADALRARIMTPGVREFLENFDRWSQQNC